jgi:hypothetical protein
MDTCDNNLPEFNSWPWPIIVDPISHHLLDHPMVTFDKTSSILPYAVDVHHWILYVVSLAFLTRQIQGTFS